MNKQNHVNLKEICIPISDSVRNRAIVRFIAKVVAAEHWKKIEWSSSTQEKLSNIVIVFNRGTKLYGKLG